MAYVAYDVSMRFFIDHFSAGVLRHQEKQPGPVAVMEHFMALIDM